MATAVRHLRATAHDHVPPLLNSADQVTRHRLCNTVVFDDESYHASVFGEVQPAWPAGPCIARASLAAAPYTPRPHQSFQSGDMQASSLRARSDHDGSGRHLPVLSSPELQRAGRSGTARRSVSAAYARTRTCPLEKSNVPKAQISTGFTHKNSGWFDVNLTCSRSRKTDDDSSGTATPPAARAILLPPSVTISACMWTSAWPSAASRRRRSLFPLLPQMPHRDGLDQNKA